MKYLFLFLLLASTATLKAQQGNTPLRKEALQAAPATLVPEQTGTGTAQRWRTQWQQWVQQNPNNAEGWFNYYLWTERDKQLSTTGREKRLTQILLEAKDNIQGTALYYLMLYLQSGKKDSLSLKQAASFTNDRAFVYPYLLQHTFITKEYHLIKELSVQLHKLTPIPDVLYDYHYNVLMSADSNGIIYARGLNDLIPLAIMQQVHQIREDVQLRYYEEGEKVPENSYLCMSLGKDILKKIPASAYTGLLLKISHDSSIRELKKNVESKFHLSYLQELGEAATDVKQLHTNYLPALIILYKHYLQAGDLQSEKIKKWIEQITSVNGMRNPITITQP